jgi:hypothetical protein
MKHTHHIVPRHMGGTDDPSNLIELTVEEHAEAHRRLYEEHECWQDKVAWQGLAGLIGHDEIMREMWDARKGEGNTFYGKQHTQETKRKISEANTGKLLGIPKSEETRHRMSENHSRYWQGKVAHNKGKKQRPATILERAKQGNPVRYNGEVHPTLAEAARAHDSTPYKIGRRCEFITLNEFIAQSK